ncbi:hypothetical protein [Metabacillus sp. FJAT-52054]|uniref:Uncharacterized protein n=1 Tax=Metabacillus sediminis TaxID=3117746 RepID=A0ABZ2NHE5_9BACI
MEEDSHFLIYGYSVIDTGLALFRGLKKFGWNAIVNGRKSRKSGWKTVASGRKGKESAGKRSLAGKQAGTAGKAESSAGKPMRATPVNSQIEVKGHIIRF